MRTLLFAAVLGLACGPAHAGGNYQSGNKLYAHRDTASFEGGFLLGYIAAAHDAMRSSGVFCLPDGEIPLGQVKDVVVKWLVNNPELRELDADIAVQRALKAVWPCVAQPAVKPAPSLHNPAAGRQGM